MIGNGVLSLNRVKYYPENDMASGYNLQRIENYNSDTQLGNINDAIEIYNIKKYFDNDIYLLSWATEQRNEYKVIIKKLYGQVACFFKDKISDKNIMEILETIDYNYKDDWWTLISTFSVHENVLEQKFSELLNHNNGYLRQVLLNKKISSHLGSIVRDYMLSNSNCAELLLEEYMYHQKENFHFPTELTNDDKVQIISDYINSDNPNVKHLGIISEIKDNQDKIIIPVDVRLNAIKKHKSEMEKIINNSPTFQNGIEVTFVEYLEDVISVENVTENENYNLTRITVSQAWIKENTDFPTLLNNFIYLFGMVDGQVRCTLVNKIKQMGELEKWLRQTASGSYLIGSAFEHMNLISLLTFQQYYNHLNKLEIRLEEVIEWFFKDYLSDEFNAVGFQINMPSKGSYFYEKCGIIMSRMESILKQFSLFVEHEKVDIELLSLTTEQLRYENIPSLIPNKYVYGQGHEYAQASHLLFSSQSIFDKRSKIKEFHSYDSFCEAVCTEKFNVNTFEKYEKASLDWLIQQNYLMVDTENIVMLENPLLIKILRNLYLDDVCYYWKYSKQERDIIDNLHRDGIVKFEQSLFSKPEQDYISYTLKRDFSNGLDLRNKYAHTDLFINEDAHFQNYMIFLRLFILVVIKINDEFCTFDTFKDEFVKYEN